MLSMFLAPQNSTHSPLYVCPNPIIPPPQVQRALPAPLPAAHLWSSTTSALGPRICFDCLRWPEPSTRDIPPHSLDARNRPSVYFLICGMSQPPVCNEICKACAFSFIRFLFSLKIMRANNRTKSTRRDEKPII